MTSAINVKKRKKIKRSDDEPSLKKAKMSSDAVTIRNKENVDETQVRMKKRPWRGKVRKKAAKLAAREKREKEALLVKETLKDLASDTGEKKRKKKKKKKKALLGKEGPSKETSGEIQKLKSARFRFINEQLYKMSGDEAVKLFEEDPEAFQVYHDGFRNQTRKWPFNPVNGIIQWLRSLDKKDLIVVDMGCGDAKIAEALEGLATVHSFDLVAANDRVTACNMSKVPLEKKSADVVVFCLSLMGTNLSDYLREANRILKKGGILKVAEVASRFTSVKQFVIAVGKMGFDLTDKKSTGAGYFIMLEFVKKSSVEQKHPSGLLLEPCYYKKR